MGACEGLGIQAAAADLRVSGCLRLRTDSAAANGVRNRSGIGRVRHLAVGQLWIQERIRDGSIALLKVRGGANPAGMRAEHLDGQALKKCALLARGASWRAGRKGPRLLPQRLSPSRRGGRRARGGRNANAKMA